MKLHCEAHLHSPHTHSDRCMDSNQNLICGQADYYAHTHAENCYNLAGELDCRMPERSTHVHSDACYKPITPAQPHTHGDSCYTVTAEELICSLPEEGHSHEDGCYEQELICTVEDEGHYHEESCYTRTLLCEREEQAGHSHGDDCYNRTRELTCGLQEGSTTVEDAFTTPEVHVVICGKLEAKTHVHDIDCFETAEMVLTCGRAEDINHSHSDLCYGQWELICDKQEHTHSLSCYSNPNADLETKEDWESSISTVKPTGLWAQDVISVAVSQLGYTESSENYLVMDDGTTKGYTRYGQWYGDPYGDWCAMFVSFCMEYAGVQDVPTESSCTRWIELLSREDVNLYREAAYHTPLPGDIVFFDYNGDKSSEHVGLVAEILYNEETEAPEQIKVVEGNSANRVQYVTYKLDDKVLFGYGDLNRAYEEYRLENTVDRYYHGDDFTVTVSLEYSNEIPDDAQLIVQKVTPALAPDVYDAGYMEANKTLIETVSSDPLPILQDYQLFDIYFLKDGARVDPAGKVKVSISFTADGELYETYLPYVIRYEGDDGKIVDSQKTVAEYDTITSTFTTESLNLCAVLVAEIRGNDYMRQTAVEEETLNDLEGTYALIAKQAALLTEGTALKVQELETVLVDDKTYFPSDSSLEIWTFEWADTNSYYITTTVSDRLYYLCMENEEGKSPTTYLLAEEQEGERTLWLAESTTPELKLKGNGAYLEISPRRVRAKVEEPSIGLYKANDYQALFDGQFGAHQYYGTEVTKYAGATRKLVNCDNNNQVELPATLDSTGVYDFKVVGWYNIVTGDYHGEDKLGTMITLERDAIFYPDYVATSYDIGQNVDVVENQPKLNFVTNHMFDYNELFNTYGATYGGGNPNLNTSANNTSGWDSNDWTTKTNGFNFVLSDWIHSNSENVDGNIGRPLSLGETNSVHNVDRDAGHTYTVDGKTIQMPNFAGIIEPGIFNDTIKNYLFTPRSDARGVHYLGQADMLYQYDAEHGFYYYNSALNAAAYNQSEQRFYVYNYTSSVKNSGSINDFLPLNYGKAQGDTYDDTGTEVNFWFGMTSEINFYLPAEVGSAENMDAFGNDMQFRFSGDDDVWVFIDDQLVLDMGGVHDIVYGEINFRTGKVVTGENLAVNTASPDNNFMPGVSGNSGVTTTNLMDIAPGEMHTLKVYYMERGSSLSNCAIYFNIAPMYELEIIKRDAKGQNLLEGAEFQIYADKDCTQIANLMVTKEDGSVEYPTVFTTNELGYVLCSGLMAGKTYYIKEIKAPKNPIDHPGYPDMSKYVIQLDLGSDGEPTVILLNSEDEEWIFADAHRISESGTRVSLTVYNEAYVGGEAKVYVEKRWDEDDAKEHEPIRVQLLANGEPTGRYLQLGVNTDWKGFYSELPEKDEDGNLIEYTLQEINVPPGYRVSYTKLEVEDYVTTFTYSWEPATAFESGEQYLLVTNNKVLATGTGDKLALTETSANALASAAGDQAYVWTATASGSGFHLRSGTGGYLNLTVAGAQRTFRQVSATTANSVMNITTAGKFYGLQNGTTKRYFQTLNNNGYGTANDRENNGATFTLYKWTRTETVTPNTYEGWLVTNTLIPPEEMVTIPVRKVWHDNVPADKIVPIEVELYLAPDAGGQATLVTTMLLDQTNGWMDSFHDLLPAEEGYHYYVREANTGFVTTYNGTLEQIQVGPEAGDTAMALRVEPLPQVESKITKFSAKPNTRATPGVITPGSLYFSFDTNENPAPNWAQVRKANMGDPVGAEEPIYTKDGYLVIGYVYNATTIVEYVADTGYTIKPDDHFEMAVKIDGAPYDPTDLYLEITVDGTDHRINLGKIQPTTNVLQTFTTAELGLSGEVESIGFSLNGWDLWADHMYIDYMYVGGDTMPEEPDPPTTETEPTEPEPTEPEPTEPEPSEPEPSEPEVTDPTDPPEPSEPDEPDEPEIDVTNGVVITNRCPTIDIPMEKYWNGVNPDIMNPVTFRLYLVEELTGEAGTSTQNVTLVKTIALSKEDDWKNSFEDVLIPESNAYYVVVENIVAGYQAFYDGETVQISIGGANPVTGIKVDYTDGVVATVKITNAPATELPATGGSGLLLYTMGGTLLLFAAGVILMYNRKNKRRKGDVLQF
ncbi:MAG: Cna B-type domain-containing protein [Oscillospiraceae bacterium]|nr:Cna B-type domain-containing protein [Oscillospiraceae bacterium]